MKGDITHPGDSRERDGNLSPGALAPVSGCDNADVRTRGVGDVIARNVVGISSGANALHMAVLRCNTTADKRLYKNICSIYSSSPTPTGTDQHSTTQEHQRQPRQCVSRRGRSNGKISNGAYINTVSYGAIEWNKYVHDPHGTLFLLPKLGGMR